MLGFSSVTISMIGNIFKFRKSICVTATSKNLRGENTEPFYAPALTRSRYGGIIVFVLFLESLSSASLVKYRNAWIDKFLHEQKALYNYAYRIVNPSSLYSWGHEF